MPFVYEELDEVAALELKGTVEKFQRVLSMSPLQVIDRERDITFAELGGQGFLAPDTDRPPSYYALIWKGLGVAFEGYDARTQSEENVKRIAIRLTGLALPQQLRGDLAEIQKAIEEVMLVLWDARNRHRVVVEVQFPQAAYY